MELQVGDMVEPVSNEYRLRSGAEAYSFAVVVSVNPFVLVSERADMRWQATVSSEHYRSFGRAGDLMMSRCMGRLDK